MVDHLLAFGIRRRVRGVDRLHAALGRPLVTARTRYGDWMNLNPLEYVDRIILQRGYYEEEVLEAVLSHLGSGDTFWDVGSNIGQHAIATASARPHANVFAFEPLPVNAGRLLRNAALNGADVQLVPVALSGGAGLGELHLRPGNSGATSLHKWDGLAPGRAICSRLAGDDCVQSGLVSPPAVLKIDVEGHEAEVLSGLSKTLASGDVRAVVFESDSGAVDAPDHPVGGLLRRAGFRVEVLARKDESSEDLYNFMAVRP